MLFYIIKENKKNLKIKRVIFFSFVVYIIPLFFIPENQDKTNFPVIMAGIAVIWVIANVISNFFIKSFKTDGEIILKPDMVLIKGEKVLLNDINYISVSLDSFYGETPNSAAVGIGGLSMKEGINNRILIRTIDEKRFDFFIWVQYMKEFKTIEKILRYYQKNGIEVSLKNKRKKIL